MSKMRVSYRASETKRLFRTMETRPPVGTHTTTPPGAALVGHGGRARMDRPKRHRHSTTARRARAAWCTPRLMRCKAVLPMQIIIATALQIFTPQHHLCTLRGCTCRANTSTLACDHPAVHCRRPGLAALLLALLHAHLTALQFLQLAAQRHSQATFPARQDLGKRVRARIPLRHRAPFDTCKADTAGQSHHPQHHPQAAPIRRPSPPIPAASAHGTFELTTSLRMTRARDSELEYLTF